MECDSVIYRVKSWKIDISFSAVKQLMQQTPPSQIDAAVDPSKDAKVLKSQASFQQLWPCQTCGAHHSTNKISMWAGHFIDTLGL